MTVQSVFLPTQGNDTARAITKIVIMAVGGQGGGVLTGWIESVARSAGRAVQATSVAGVAQRTGATIYYIELAPEGVTPVFALSPSAGDVDVLIAAEWMEAGRAIQRGFVTPDRTVLVASTHRALAVSEKSVPGDGIADGDAVMAAAELAAQRLVAADFEQLAVVQGSVISASLLGALAGSCALPFARAAFEDAILASGKGVEASLRAFAAGFAASSGQAGPEPVKADVSVQSETASAGGAYAALEARVSALPDAAKAMATAGLAKVVGFQDVAYGADFLDRVEAFALRDRDPDAVLTKEAAKHIANAMAYDDIIRVADAKTRATRLARIDAEMARSDGQTLHLTEYFHPRAAEIAGLLPARLGAWIEASESWMARLTHWFDRGRRVRTDRLKGFVTLYLIAGLRGYRRRTHRHAVEQAHLARWLDLVWGYLDSDPELATEVLRCRRLIKGYSDTHARGLSKFDRVLTGIALVAGRADAADWARRLREAALRDEEGKALDGALATIQSFTQEETP